MKKLLVFLSIFAVLFVSTIRPLQAEYIADDFTLVNGTTYYFVLDKDTIINEYLIAYSENVYPTCEIIMFENGFDDIVFDVKVKTSPSATTQYFTIELNYIGVLDSYTANGNTFEYPYVYSFVWTPPTCPNLGYDDYLFGFDSENPFPPFSIYDTIYSLINKFVFGNSIESGTHQDLTATILSTCICVLVFALPFLIIWKVIKIIMG